MLKYLLLPLFILALLCSGGMLFADTGTPAFYQKDEFAPIGPTGDPKTDKETGYRYRPAISYTKKILFGGVLGAGSGFLILHFLPKASDDPMTVGFAYFGIVPLLTSLGVYLGGFSESEPGGFGWVTLGSYVGGGATTVIYTLISSAAGSENRLEILLPVTIIGALAGAIFAYNWDCSRYGAAVTADSKSAAIGMPEIFMTKNSLSGDRSLYLRLARFSF